MASEISFTTTKEEFALLGRIADRAIAILRENSAPGLRGLAERRDFLMDLSAVHANGNPLRLADLLAADDFNFIHDVFGIVRRLDRETGKLNDHFVPRFSKREARPASKPA